MKAIGFFPRSALALIAQWTIAIVALGWTSRASAADLDFSLRVSVGISATVADYSNPGEDVALRLTIPDALDPTTGRPYQETGGSDVALTAALEPGKLYTLVCDEDGTSNASETLVFVTAPAGYAVEIDHIVRGVYTGGGYLRIVPLRDRFTGPAGTASSITGGKIYWQVALGSLLNGDPAPCLALHAAATGSWTDEEIFTPKGLSVQAWADEVVPVFVSHPPYSLPAPGYVAGELMQVLTNEAFVDIVPDVSRESYQIKFYSRINTTRAATYPHALTGNPFVIYTVAKGDTATTLKITRQDYSSSGAPLTPTSETKLTRTLPDLSKPKDFVWTVEDWHIGTQATVVEERAWEADVDSFTETITRKNPQTNVTSSVVKRLFSRFKWGWELVAVERGEAGLAHRPREEFQYYWSLSEGNSNWGKLAARKSAAGAWEAFRYDTSGRFETKFRPFVGTPAEPPGWNDPTSNPATWDTSSIGSGEILTYAYSRTLQDRAYNRVSSIQTKVNGTNAGATTITYVDTTAQKANNKQFVQATRAEQTGRGDTLTTITKYYKENIGDDVYRNQIHSIQRPDGVKQSFAYQRGYWNGTSFDLTPSALSNNENTAVPPYNGLGKNFPNGHVGRDKIGSRTFVITGIVGSGHSTESNYDIDDLSLVDGKSTMEVTIRDERALIVRMETHARVSSAWVLVGSVDYTYDPHANRLTTKTANNGAVYSATYENGRLKSETDESGVKITYTYDTAWRIDTATKENGPVTRFTYDADNHVLSHTLGGSITNNRSYDTAGRLRSEMVAGHNPVIYDYDVAARRRTTTFKPTSSSADDTTRIETYHADGRLEKIEGSAVVATYYAYGVDATNGQRWVEQKTGNVSSSRRSKAWSDWLGRFHKRTWAGFAPQGVPAPGDITEAHTYGTTAGVQSSIGHLIKVERTGYAPTLYQHDALGAVFRVGVDVSRNGAIDTDGGPAQPWLWDLITEYDEQFVHDAGTSAYWLSETTRTYPHLNGNPISVGERRRRLTNLPSGYLDEAKWIDAEGNTVDRKIAVNRGSKTMTVTTTRAGIANAETEVFVNGLPTSVQGHDGLTRTTEYDTLSRLWRQTDQRGSRVTTTYHPGTRLVQSITDGADNTVVTYGYDGLGRVTSTRNAENHHTFSSYTPRGQLRRQWGAARYPIEYDYDPVYGDLTTQKTYRAGTATYWNASIWPGDPGASTNQDDPDDQRNPVSMTTWTYDIPSGLLWKKTDAGGPSQTVEYHYNERRQVSKRIGSRGIHTDYAYDPNTGDLTDISYSDGTPSVHYTYTRLRQLNSVTDTTGNRTFTYDSSQPLRLLRENLGSYYGNRTLTRLYEDATVEPASGTLSSVKGRPIGFELGIVTATGRDLEQRYSFTDTGRFGVISTRAGTALTRDVVYSYYQINSSAPVVDLVGGYRVEPPIAGGSTFEVSRSFEANRDLVASVESRWGSTTFTRFEYRYNKLGQRRTAQQSGTAFSDYTGAPQTGVFNYYTYNPRGELQQAAMFSGSLPAVNSTTKDTPAPSAPAATELPGRRFEYLYDAIGNRKSAGPGAISGGGTTPDDAFTSNTLNQYSGRENNTVRVLATAAAEAKVAVQSSGAINPIAITSKPTDNRNAAADIAPRNQDSPARGEVTAYAYMPSSGQISRKNVLWFAPPDKQTLKHDLDGNLEEDGVWRYYYDAENRLFRMTSLLPENAGFTRLELNFTYDYLGRRVEKKVTDMASPATPFPVRRYVYDGWNLVAELDGSGNSIQRSYTWGLDIADSLRATGGVGALLRITNWSGGSPGANYYPTHDANGNVAAVVRDDSELAAVYEYSPYGEPLRVQTLDTTLGEQPFRFSTKFHDDETGLVYYGHRYYSHTHGRFINRDPIGEAGGSNLYRFANNDPINGIDVLGLTPPSEADSAGRGGGRDPFADFGFRDASMDAEVGGYTGASIQGGRYDPTLPPRIDHVRRAQSADKAKIREAVVTGKSDPRPVAPDSADVATGLVVTRGLPEALATRPPPVRPPLRPPVSIWARLNPLGFIAALLTPTTAHAPGIDHDFPPVKLVDGFVIPADANSYLLSEWESARHTDPERARRLMSEIWNERNARALGLVTYRPTVPGFENHHGVLDVWATHNISGYVSRGADTPAISLSKAQHDATRAVYRQWLKEKTGREVGGQVDWKSVSAQEAQALTERMFDAAGVSAELRGAYYRAFHQYIYAK